MPVYILCGSYQYYFSSVKVLQPLPAFQSVRICFPLSMLQRSHPNPNHQMSPPIFPPLPFLLHCLLRLLSHLMLHFLLPLLMAMLLFLLITLSTTQLLSTTCFCTSGPIKLGTAHATAAIVSSSTWFFA